MLAIAQRQCLRPAGPAPQGEANPVSAGESQASQGVRRKIIGFHQDEQGDWVAELECGHQQHVRHDPPWTLRKWVTTAEGRQAHLGRELHCKHCVSGAPRAVID